MDSVTIFFPAFHHWLIVVLGDLFRVEVLTVVVDFDLLDVEEHVHVGYGFFG